MLLMYVDHTKLFYSDQYMVWSALHSYPLFLVSAPAVYKREGLFGAGFLHITTGSVESFDTHSIRNETIEY